MVMNEPGDPRSFLASRLDELWRAAGTPLLDRIAKRCQTGRSTEGITGKRISAWKTGENVPRKFEDLNLVTSILMTEARRRHVTEDALTSGIFDQRRWRAWWERAQQSSSHTSHDRNAGLRQGRVGRPLMQVTNPYDMEIHPTIEASEGDTVLPQLTPYVMRAHDHRLRQVVTAARDQSDIAVVVGDSSTGKTRACWEAIRALPSTWYVWHPISPSRPEALWKGLSEGLIGPRTVVWLNELNFYLDTPDTELGENIGAALRDLLRSSDCSPVLVLGTLWRDHWDILTRYPSGNTKDRHSQARSLLRNHEIAVPAQFSPDDINALKKTCTDDPRMMEAGSRTDGKVTQFLAGAFELTRRYNMASPTAHAIITAAIDIRRFGRQQSIAEDFLLNAAQGYLDDDTWDQLTDDWGISAIDYATQRCLGVPGPLTRVRPRLGQSDPDIPSYRLSDYLDQEGRKARRFSVPPERFWSTSLECVSPLELLDLALEAESRARFRWAAVFYIQLAQEDDLSALQFLAEHRLQAGDERAAGSLLREALERGHTKAWIDLAQIEESKGNVVAAEELLERMGDDTFALEQRARLRALSGDYGEAQRLLEMAAQDSLAAKRELAIFLESQNLDLDRARELREELGADNVIDRLVASSEELRRLEKLLDEAEDSFITAASENEGSMTQALSIRRGELGADTAESVSDLIVAGRIERNLGLTNAAKASFKRALDGGSMREDGTNRALSYLAEIMEGEGDVENAKLALKYGLKLDGSIATPWIASMDAPQRVSDLDI
jgi:hypothetical protein